MKRLGFLALCLAASLLVSGCATTPSPPPLGPAEIVALAKSGATGPQIIEELRRTNTVLMLHGSDFARLAEQGVPKEVLDYLHQQMIAEIRWRDSALHAPYGPFYGGPGFGLGFGFGRWR
jgi:hypothetical protein